MGGANIEAQKGVVRLAGEDAGRQRIPKPEGKSGRGCMKKV